MSKPLLPEIDCDWTLFLDRDGTINKRIIDDYVKRVKEFQFLPKSLESLRTFNDHFAYIIVVTNQQGIDRDLMTHEDLKEVHEFMLQQVNSFGGRIDEVFYCPQLAYLDPFCRKPNPGMGFQAREMYPEIDFKKSIMVGDSESDINFGKKLEMYSVLVSEKLNPENDFGADLVIQDLGQLAELIKQTT